MLWILISILLVVGVGIVIFWPYLHPQPVAAASSRLDPRLAELYTRRDMLYQAIRDARFDMETGKLSPEDFEAQTAALKHAAADVLRAIDQLEAELISPELDAMAEAAIARARAQPPVVGESNGESKGSGHVARFCSQCGAPVQAADRFCSQCGQRLG
ncbi:MAG: zinc-ribbon domain-containing protein [Caldilineae bacterium]|nr:MAG: zinc-ribbon domain-containing protein [Caldilineae bacterium]